MGDCIYCGKPAGFLHSQHKDCEAAHLAAADEIAAGIRETLARSVSPASLRKVIENAAAKGFVPKDEQRALLIAGWKHALDEAIDSGSLEEAKERQLIQFMIHERVFAHEGRAKRFTLV